MYKLAPEKNLSCPCILLALKVQLVILVSAFMMISTVWSVSCLLFFYSRCPPCPAICKSGDTCSRALYSQSAPLFAKTTLVDVVPKILLAGSCTGDSYIFQVSWKSVEGSRSCREVENCPLSLTWPMTHTTACTTLHAVIQVVAILFPINIYCLNYTKFCQLVIRKALKSLPADVEC